ncbi:MAG: hypothetical protein HZB36_06065 [Candidatus Omnitrophica bacterium]|nr:hypothetical protein [Candidatus Omnitrophota bacterium]
MQVDKVLKNIFFASIIVCGIAFFQKDTFPPPSEILSQLFREPLQTETIAKPFSIKKGGITYQITPLYNYELYGMVVSYHLASSWWDYYHGEWKDALNSKDLGVVWGDNIKSGVYQDMRFKSGSWTLYWNAKSGKDYAWSKFKNEAISNNHLLSSDAKVSRAIMGAQLGDQIYMKGYLANYSHSNGAFNRGTSTCRTDTGNSCETVFVTDFKVLKKANVFWRILFRLSKYIVFISLIAWFAVYYNRVPGLPV